MYRRPSLFVLIIIALASFGFVFRMITDPLGLLNQLFFFAVIAAVIFLVVKFVMQKRMGPQASAYQKAVKQSKLRYQQQKPKFNMAASTKASKPKLNNKKTNSQQKKKGIKPLLSPKRNKDHNFKVIEGNKGKKKNRAFF